MQKSRVRRVGALLVGLSLVAAACGDDDEESTSTEPDVTEPAGDTTPATEPPTDTTPPGTEPTDTAETAPPGTTGEGGGGELAGMRGTTPGTSDVSDWIAGVNDFWVAAGNAELSDFNYAAETYDAALVIALAVAAAGDDGSAHASEIVGITRDGEKCGPGAGSDFAGCLALIDAGTDIDYDGISGPLDFNGNGEPLAGSYAVLEFGADNRIDESLTETVQAQSPESMIVDEVPVGVERAGDGVLKIGSLLPETGSLAFLGPPEFAGLAFAIDEINAAGGVLGAPVEYTSGDSGDTTTDIASVTSDRLIGEGVDAIIGAASSGVTLTVIDKITQAGVTMFSPANTSTALTDYPDNGLFFRDAPPDGLQGAVVSQLILEDGNASAYILNLDDAYGNGIADVIEDVLTASGVEVLGKVAYDPAAAGFDSEVADVVSADPDAIVLISFDEGSRILRTMIEQGIGPSSKNFYGTDGNMGNALGENFDAGT
ncbi:MAG TPA: ABC transporter substrate-binding protein [Ilumatobacteraceae bacterium]|nr:ABC transporter substrate-binding protein [Ilumatobacteraceae bacterium]